MKSPNPVLAALCASFLLAGCGAETGRQRVNARAAPVIHELQKNDVRIGAGEGASAGQTAVVHYTGWLYDPNAAEQKGAKFDSSRDRGQPFRFTIGGGNVIKGWDEGVQGMQVGGQRRLVIPPHLAYGDQGAGGAIPPNAPLLFDIELLAIEQPR